MAVRIIEIVGEKGIEDRLNKAITELKPVDHWQVVDQANNLTKISVLLRLEKIQQALDLFSDHIRPGQKERIVVLPVSATLPKVQELEETQAEENGDHVKLICGISREELYDNMMDGAKLDLNFVWLVLLSTLVAALGLLENSDIILIGAMLIAPLLGPNLALAFGSTVGDFKLMFKAIKTNLAGILTCVAFAFCIGVFFRFAFHEHEVPLHFRVGYESMVLASASGAAATLSLLTGLSSTLVGVMVAVALLPPATLIGLALSLGHIDHLLNASFLLVINIVCINLFANITFLLKGIRPSKWYEKQQANKANFWHIMFLLTTLVLLSFVIYIWGKSIAF